jgi:hypothetical protein
MKKITWLFIDLKNHILIVMDFWSQNIWIGHLIRPSQTRKDYINTHSKFFIATQYMM